MAGLLAAGIVLGLTGLFGVAYVLRVIYRTKRLTTYRAETEDWVWYTVLPLVAYVTIVLVAFLLPNVAAGALFALAGATMLLIFIAIHNAWDIVTFLAIDLSQEPPGPPPPKT